MKNATVTATFTMRNAWDERDTADTGLQPARGVDSFLRDAGLMCELAALARRFGLELHRCGVTTYEQEATT